MAEHKFWRMPTTPNQLNKMNACALPGAHFTTFLFVQFKSPDSDGSMK
jgi:hypothetical protein